MSDAPLFAGSVPENYDRYLRPLLFEPYAVDLAARLEVRPAMRVLELACGTGILTRALLGRLPGDATLIATDISEQMLAIAQQRVSPDQRLAWQPADAGSLPFDDASVDAALCQFGIMFFPDKDAAVAQWRRVLRKNGQLLFNVWDALERDRIAQVTHDALGAAFPGRAPKFLTIPFGFHDEEVLQRLVSGAGFSSVRIERVTARGHSPSAHDAAAGLLTGSPMAGELAEAGIPVDDALAIVERAITYEYGEGPLDVPLSAVVVAARA
jgi:ubiquinone/menaquinone biosynthesis C-methylase UbiE